MRVIAGAYRGRIIYSVSDRSVRPATDRVRQTIFDLLTSRTVLEGTAVLDLFAGSGSLGIEALSRGARHITFVEKNDRAAASIQRNLDALGCTSQAEILQMDARSFIFSAHPAFDLVFADPPYAYEGTKELVHETFRHRLLNPGGYLIIEHTKDLHFESTQVYNVGPVKKFGTTLVTFFQSASSGQSTTF